MTNYIFLIFLFFTALSPVDSFAADPGCGSVITNSYCEDGRCISGSCLQLQLQTNVAGGVEKSSKVVKISSHLLAKMYEIGRKRDEEKAKEDLARKEQKEADRKACDGGDRRACIRNALLIQIGNSMK